MSKESVPVVHVVDDEQSMRKSLEMLIESASLPVQVHDSAEDLLSHANLHEPGCIVLDLRMPGMSGIELLQRLREEMIDIPVIIISGHADVPTAVRGMKLGAVDVLQKPVEATVLIEAIRRSLDLSVALHRRHLSDLSVRQRFAGLTPRQLELLRLVVDGKSNKQIAIAMGISVKTVANHRASLMTRTGATNAAELARLYTIADAASADVRPPRDL